MGVRSTHLITRETAIMVMMSRLSKVTDYELAEMLESFPESHFRTYKIVDQSEMDENDKKEWPTKAIKSIENF